MFGLSFVFKEGNVVVVVFFSKAYLLDEGKVKRGPPLAGKAGCHVPSQGVACSQLEACLLLVIPCELLFSSSLCFQKPYPSEKGCLF